MIKYVSFLRGINVGGHKIIKMANLKKIYEKIKGVENVRTYIQSGNVIFESTETNESVLRKLIEDKLNNSLGYEVKTFLRPMNSIKKIIKNNPFKDETRNGYKTYITFLNDKMNNEVKIKLYTLNNSAENYKIIMRDIYTLIDKKNKKEKIYFSNNLLEKILKTEATTRDLNTINKILDFGTQNKKKYRRLIIDGTNTFSNLLRDFFKIGICFHGMFAKIQSAEFFLFGNTYSHCLFQNKPKHAGS